MIQYGVVVLGIPIVQSENLAGRIYCVYTVSNITELFDSSGNPNKIIIGELLNRACMMSKNLNAALNEAKEHLKYFNTHSMPYNAEPIVLNLDNDTGKYVQAYFNARQAELVQPKQEL